MRNVFDRFCAFDANNCPSHTIGQTVRAIVATRFVESGGNIFWMFKPHSLQGKPKTYTFLSQKGKAIKSKAFVETLETDIFYNLVVAVM